MQEIKNGIDRTHLKPMLSLFYAVAFPAVVEEAAISFFQTCKVIKFCKVPKYILILCVPNWEYSVYLHT